MKFYKYHALGNDYIVLDPAEFTAELTKVTEGTLSNEIFD
jgi:diaminopimelate epimerase